MPYLFKSASLVTLDPPALEEGDLRNEGPLIRERAPSIEPRPDDEVIDARGKLLIPGMVCAHTHLYSALARGMPPPPRVPNNFREILELIWWRLDRALDEETIYYSALAGAIEAARAGTTCLIDHHASPSYVTGSLQLVRQAIEEVGLRAVLCYEVTDRSGENERDLGVEENRKFLSWTREAASDPNSNEAGCLFRAMVGAHASFTLSDESLRMLGELTNWSGAGLHIHVAEDRCDTEDCRDKYGIGIVERLAGFDLLGDSTILAHGVHLSEREIDLASEHQCWFAHNPRSNMNNRVGYAPIERFGDRVLLGTDGIGADMLEETHYAFYAAQQAKLDLPQNYWLRVLANNQRFASQLFGVDLGSLQPGSAADFVVLNYESPTPITSENLAAHFVFGITSAAVESTMVGGRFVWRDCLPAHSKGSYAGLLHQIRRAAERLWSKLG